VTKKYWLDCLLYLFCLCLSVHLLANDNKLVSITNIVYSCEIKTTTTSHYGHRITEEHYFTDISSSRTCVELTENVEKNFDFLVRGQRN
jgi:predicted transcriptional regulator